MHSPVYGGAVFLPIFSDEREEPPPGGGGSAVEVKE